MTTQQGRSGVRRGVRGALRLVVDQAELEPLRGKLIGLLRDLRYLVDRSASDRELSEKIEGVGHGLRLVFDQLEREHKLSGRVPPHNLDAEAAVLSACMLSREAIDEVSDLLQGEHFYSDANGKIFQAIRALADKGDPVDLVTVIDWLRAKDWLQQAGGSSYIAEIVDATPARAHLRKHAEIVHEQWRWRQMIATCQRVAAMLYDPEHRSEPGMMDQIVVAVNAVATSDARSHAVPMTDAMKEAMDAVQAHRESSSDLLGLSTGFPDIDLRTGGLVRREVTLLGGQRKGGKSSLMRQWAAHIARHPQRVSVPQRDGSLLERFQEQAVAIFSFEMKPHEVAHEMACCYGEVDGLTLRNKTASEFDYRRLIDASEWIKKLPIYTIGDRGFTLAQIRAEMRRLQIVVAKRPVPEGFLPARLGLVVIDTLQILVNNELRYKAPNELDERIYNKVATAIGSLAVDFDVPILVITQLNKDGEARGSRAIEQDANAMMRLRVHKEKVAPSWSVHDPRAPREAELEIVCARKGGDQQSVPLWFRPAWTKFESGG